MVHKLAHLLLSMKVKWENIRNCILLLLTIINMPSLKELNLLNLLLMQRLLIGNIFYKRIDSQIIEIITINRLQSVNNNAQEALLDNLSKEVFSKTIKI